MDKTELDELLARLEAKLDGANGRADRNWEKVLQAEANLEAEHYLRESAQQRALQAEDAYGHIAVKLREVEAATIERCAKVCDQHAHRWDKFLAEGSAPAQSNKPAWLRECARLIRALAPERTVAGQESSSALKTGSTVSATVPDPAPAAAPVLTYKRCEECGRWGGHWSWCNVVPATDASVCGDAK